MLITSLVRRFPYSSPTGFKVPLRHFYKQGKHKIYTMDDLPVPRGCWKEVYERNNLQYTKVLALGIAMFSGVVIFGYTSECINYRYAPPLTYEDEDEDDDKDKK